MCKKGLIYRLLALAVVSVVLLAACGGDDGGDDDGAASNGVEEETSEEVDLRVAIILPGRADDFGYSQLGADALKRVEEELGAQTAIAETVEVDQQVETFRDFANQGYNLIVGWGGQYEDGATQVAEEFPDVYFTVFAGEGGNGNYSSTFLNVEQWEFLVGYVDANVTKSNKIGQIAGPCFAGTAWEVHGVNQGVDYAAEELGKDIEVKTVSLESFDDPSAAKEAALALIDEGADVLHVGLNTGNLGVFEAAKERDVLVSTQFFDQSSEDPKHILTSSIQPSTEPLVVAATKVVDGTFDGEPIRVPITADEEGIAGFNGLAPDSLFKKTKELQGAVASGEVSVEADGSCPY